MFHTHTHPTSPCSYWCIFILPYETCINYRSLLIIYVHVLFDELSQVLSETISIQYLSLDTTKTTRIINKTHTKCMSKLTWLLMQKAIDTYQNTYHNTLYNIYHNTYQNKISYLHKYLHITNQSKPINISQSIKMQSQ